LGCVLDGPALGPEVVNDHGLRRIPQALAFLAALVVKADIFLAVGVCRIQPRDDLLGFDAAVFGQRHGHNLQCLGKGLDGILVEAWRKAELVWISSRGRDGVDNGG
jgi:hypothetical protein